jgi:7,8-dihydropterin-6-yl-methyl-4-(beta-D-ribofuranosyl)aminobenzene 5'-phosphate synthase
MNIKMTTLAENTAGLGFLAEWGLSMLVEADGKKVLFDTGAGIAALHNASILGVDLAVVDRIVLSHGHRDHTGGLREVLGRMRRGVEVIAHPDIWAPKYTRLGNQPVQYSGVPFCRELLESLGARFNLTKEPVRLTDRFLTTGEIPMLSGYEEIDSGLLVREEDGLKPDKLSDDLALVIDTDFGLVVILGCGHRGIVNTLEHARKLTGKELVYAAIGGTHLINASKARLEKTVAALKEMGVQYLGVSHCTGFKASCYLAREFGKGFFLNNAGTVLKLPFE